MKNTRFLGRRFAALAFLTVLATSAFAQGPGGPGGPPPDGQGGPGGGRRGGPPAVDRLQPLAMLATRPEVAEDLGLSDDQIEKIQTIAQSLGGPGRRPGGLGGDMGGPLQGGGRGRGGGRGPGAPAEREKAEAEADAKVKAVLSGKQAKRLDEIQIQTMGLTAAMVPAVQAKLGLSDDQKARLKALVPVRRQGGPGGPGGPPPDRQGGQGGPPPPDVQGDQGGGRRQGGPGGGRNDGRRKELETKIAAILTDGQKADLKAMGGKPLPQPDGNRPPEDLP